MNAHSKMPKLGGDDQFLDDPDVDAAMAAALESPATRPCENLVEPARNGFVKSAIDASKKLERLIIERDEIIATARKALAENEHDQAEARGLLAMCELAAALGAGKAGA